MSRHKNTKTNLFKYEVERSQNNKKLNPKEIAILELYDLDRGHFEKSTNPNRSISDLVINYKYVFSQIEMDKITDQMDKWEYLEYLKWRELIDITKKYDLIGYNYFLGMMNYFNEYNLIFNRINYSPNVKDTGFPLKFYSASLNKFCVIDEIYQQMASSFSNFGRFLISVLINQLILSSPFNEEEFLTIKGIESLYLIKTHDNQNLDKNFGAFNERRLKLINYYIEILKNNLNQTINDQMVIMRYQHPFCFSETISIETIERFILKKINKYFPPNNDGLEIETVFTKFI